MQGIGAVEGRRKKIIVTAAGRLFLINVTTPLLSAFYWNFSGDKPDPDEQVHKLSGNRHAYSYCDYTEDIPDVSWTFMFSRIKGKYTAYSLKYFAILRSER